jgi:hypothetical protein
MTWRTWLLGILLFPLGAGCSGTSGGPVDGRVIDEETGQGVAGAYVMVRWTGYLEAGSIGGSPRLLCYHIEVTRADGSGKYHVPRWTATKGNEAPYVGGINFHPHDFLFVTAYAPGYRLSRHHKSTSLDATLVKFGGNFAERRDTDATIVSGWQECAFSRADAEKMKPMWKAISDEELNLATTPNERKVAVERMLEIDFTLDYRDAGGLEAHRRLDEGVSRALSAGQEGKR